MGGGTGTARNEHTGRSPRRGNAFHRTYSTADGHIAVACLEPHFAKALASLVGSEHEALEKAFAAEPTAYWIDFAAEHDLPIERVALG